MNTLTTAKFANHCNEFCSNYTFS